MCFHSKQSKSAQELQNRFKAKFDNEALFTPSIYNGFQFPKTPVITNKQPEKIHFFNWGLIPFWAKDDSIKKNTLNARIETIHEKPAFRNSINNRCLILADGFYEWQWLDDKGKQKQKYELTLPDNELFAFAGLYSEWTDKSTGEIINTYTILTTEANELMSKIHNTKKRMPIIISKDSEQTWLNGQDLIMQNDRLKATAV
ncbi:MAG: SOS response-associated peptidase [Bacteroidia bacterium]|nr:SOS response-associated peptidase [Bacteroidia bacterium]MCO5253442.1 SOS response-associated peptidase [Bacteroidota bacterium]MCZ2129895.1 SOS response-associated peptidase [Bacteroidia bacterium]